MRWHVLSRETINDAGKQPRHEIRMSPVAQGKYQPHQGLRERYRRGGELSGAERRDLILKRSQRPSPIPYEGHAL